MHTAILLYHFCLSVTLRYCIETSGHFVTVFDRLVVLSPRRHYRILREPLNVALKCTMSGRNFKLSTEVAVFLNENLS